METRTDQAARDKVLELIRDTHIAMLASRGEGGRMHARPMGVNTAEFDGTLWFFTDAESPKVDELRRDPEVLVTFSDEKSQNYVSITGRAEIVRDPTKAKALWSEAMRTWFPKGSDDPRIALLKVDVEVAEYWDSPSSTMVYAYGYLKAVTTGERPHPGDTGTVRF
ncbi:pyridoxamine 5'-phosphate oxidase family protein [Alsobacter sp. SYSU M60028]|uniref:Pyridoxamine 5'-phosphate oxidase family protein n=1 Tax=Alsobacter ponti TaxID=2962936 RepID=A0ABT1L8X3_9HYPH|nr:pyridoxamine 5'-phosphate oxidase family protein [Alsobacter ponti]MCP8937869.1 pyridoxamine 5'-phosphate oxidase family protein [Alsobacter ponti]